MHHSISRRRSRVLALAGVAITWAACAPTPTPPDAAADPHSDSRVLRAETHRQGAHVPGMAVAWLADGQVDDSRAFGVADAESGRAVTVDTVFEAASLSKPVTAYLALIFAERGDIDLEAPLQGYASPDPPVADDPRLGDVTALHVLTHGSGLPNWRGGRFSSEPQPMTLRFDPGARFSYSGEGFMWLQRALETIAGEPLQTLAARQIFEPLGMDASSFVWRSDYDEGPHAAARPHDMEGVPDSKRKPEEAGAAFSLHTTAADYARFVAEVLRPTLVPEPAVQRMLAPPFVRSVKAPDAESTSDDVAWGLGWGLEMESGVARTLWHWGDNGPFKCFVMADLRSGDGFTVFANSDNGLALAEAMAEDSLPGDHPAFPWLDVGRYDSPAFRLPLELLAAADADAVVARLEELAPELADDELEQVVNRTGYQLLSRRRLDSARAVLRWNTERFPGSANAWDSRGEAEWKSGYLEAAIEFYGKSLELDPDNANARESIERIRTEAASGEPR